MMTLIKLQAGIRLTVLIGILPFLLGGCNFKTGNSTSKTAGLNGGFEISNKNGLPVNWGVYTPEQVPVKDFTIVLDQQVFREGKQSLKFDVKKCSSIGGRYSPGFTNEFFEVGPYKGDANYKVSFWARNDGARFRVAAGGVSSKKGDEKILVESSESFNEWKYFEYKVHVAKDKWLRMELSILEPGQFWIDDVHVQKVQEQQTVTGTFYNPAAFAVLSTGYCNLYYNTPINQLK
jgi:hypothetical protein